MKYCKLFFSLISTIALSNALCIGTSSPAIDIFFEQNGIIKSNYYQEGIIPGDTYSFDIIFKNSSKTEDANILVAFVDGTTTSDSQKNKACSYKNNLLGKYITGDNVINIPSQGSITKTYTIQLPYYYQLSGNIAGCITVSTFNNDSIDAGAFVVTSRKANFIDIQIGQSSDTTKPTIISIYPDKGSKDIDPNSSINIKFSESMNSFSVKNAIKLIGSYILDWNNDYTELTIRPINGFQGGTNYSFTLSSDATDIAGNHIESDFSLHFTTKENKKSYNHSSSTHKESKIEKDNCPYGDYSSNLYDGSCGLYNEVEEMHNSADNKGTCTINTSKYNNETNTAYKYACNIGITTQPTILEANMMGGILRKELAKMISVFDIKTLGNKADKSKECIFNDLKNETEETRYYAELACQLGLMGLEADGVNAQKYFNPNRYVTRAQFGTVVSRMLWGITYSPKNKESYYQKHLNALYQNGIMTQIDGNRPNEIEIRGRVMLMLMRIGQNNVISDSSYLTQDLLEKGNITVNFNSLNETYYTNKDYIEFKGSISNSENVNTIHITHYNSNGEGAYNDYILKKYKPGSSSFAFYAYKGYNSLTINDNNIYKFDFYDEEGTLIKSKIIEINHNYTY